MYFMNGLKFETVFSLDKNVDKLTVFCIPE